MRSALRDPITAMIGRVDALDFVDIVELVPLRLYMSRQGYLERMFVGTGIEISFHSKSQFFSYSLILARP